MSPLSISLTTSNPGSLTLSSRSRSHRLSVLVERTGLGEDSEVGSGGKTRLGDGRWEMEGRVTWLERRVLTAGEQALPTGPLGARGRSVRTGRDAGPQRCEGVE